MTLSFFGLDASALAIALGAPYSPNAAVAERPPNADIVENGAKSCSFRHEEGYLVNGGNRMKRNVIPAKAQNPEPRGRVEPDSRAARLDSRFRGNDTGFY
jgi:hypothetical protein